MAEKPGFDGFGVTLALAVTALLALATSGCVHHHHGRGEIAKQASWAPASQGGPPAWAPAHGHRRKHGAQRSDHGDLEIVFDAALGVYVVVGHPDHYYEAGYYYRSRVERWEVAVRIQGPWQPVASADLPPGLHRKALGKRRGGGAHPAKRAP
jgi:hypothetical protein